MAEQRGSGSLESYVESIDRSISSLWVHLALNHRLEDFHYKDQLEKILGGIGHLRKYSAAIIRYRPDIEYGQDLMDEIYAFRDTLKEYVEKGFGARFKDNSEITTDIGYIISEKFEKYVLAAKKILGEYMPHALPKKVLRKEEGEESKGAEVKVIVGIVLLSLSFVGLKTLGLVGRNMTGFFSLPTAEFAGINFEMLYVITSSMILGIYVLGKAMKKW